MPTINFRLSNLEKAELEAAARRHDQTISDYIRSSLRLRELDEYGNALDRLTDVELRLARIEELAHSQL